MQREYLDEMMDTAINAASIPNLLPAVEEQLILPGYSYWELPILGFVGISNSYTQNLVIPGWKAHGLCVIYSQNSKGWMKTATADPGGDQFLYKEHFGWSLISLGKTVFHYNPGKFLSDSFTPPWNAYQLSLLFKMVGKKAEGANFQVRH